MTRTNTTPLSGGTPFPEIDFPLVEGGRLKLPRPGAYNVILLYRGKW